MALYKSKQKITIKPIEIKDWILKYNSIHYLTVEIILNVNVAQILESDKTVLYQIKKLDNTIIASFTHTFNNNDSANYDSTKLTIDINKNKTTYDLLVSDTSYLEKNFFHISNSTPINVTDVETDISLYMYIKNNSGNDTEYKEVTKSKNNKKIKSSENVNLLTNKSDYGNGNSNNFYNDYNNPKNYYDILSFLTKGLNLESNDSILFKMNNIESSLQTLTSYTNNFVSPSSAISEYCKIELELKYLSNSTLLDLSFGLGHNTNTSNIIYRNFNPLPSNPTFFNFSKTSVYSDLKNSIYARFTESGLLNLFNISDEEIISGNDKTIKIILTAKTKGIVYVNITELLTSPTSSFINKEFNSTNVSLTVFYSNPYPTPLRLSNYDFVDTQQISLNSQPLVYTNYIEIMDIYDSSTKNIETYQIDTYLKKNSTSNIIKINKTSFYGLKSALASSDFGTDLSKSSTTTKSVDINIPFLKTLIVAISE